MRHGKKYLTTSDCKKFTNNILDEKITMNKIVKKKKKKKIVNESYISDFVKKTNFDDKLKNINTKLLQIKQ